MTKSRPTVAAVAEQLLHVFPALDGSDQRISLALYRRLAEGSPVAPAALAAELGLPLADVEGRLRGWPGVNYDSERQVVGYSGLALARTAHRLRIDGRELYAWCAWDTLFLPELLGRNAEVVSACRASGEPVRLSVSPRAVESAEPQGLVVSFLVPGADAVRADVITSFCRYVHFFGAAERAAPWLAEHPEAVLLTLEEAHDVGRRRARARYSALTDRS